MPKVWLHPRITDAQAWALADSLGCRLTWRGRGVALVPALSPVSGPAHA